MITTGHIDITFFALGLLGAYAVIFHMICILADLIRGISLDGKDLSTIRTIRIFTAICWTVVYAI